MNRIVSYLIALGGVIVTSPMLLSAQEANDSLLLQDFQFLKNSDPWLSGPNAGGLTRLDTDHLTDAQLYYQNEQGGFVNYFEAARSRTIGANIESFYRLNRRIVLYGHMGYDNFAGKNMTGSAFINPTRLPFDIVESTLDNPGRKHLDTYSLSGAASGDIYKGFALGARIDYTAANYAKYKDLRHKNNLMDLSLTAGLYIPIAEQIQIGLNYLYRRSTESVQFSIYGNTDIVYKSLVNYGAFFGKTETFGEQGYTDKNNELPLFNEYHGFALQASWDITRTLSWYNNLAYKQRKGYYGKKSYYTISHNQFDGNQFEYAARLTLCQSRNRHHLDLSFSTEALDDYSNTYREVENSTNSARYYEYYTPVLLSKKTWTNASIAYTGYYGIRHLSSKWKLAAGVNFMKREFTVFEHPYSRKQNLSAAEFFINSDRNIAIGHAILTPLLGYSFKKGNGDIYHDSLLATPSDKQKQPAEMTTFLHREYQFLTAPQQLISAALKYAFIIPQTQMKTYAQLGINHLATSKKDPYLEGRSHTQLNITLGCTF